MGFIPLWLLFAAIALLFGTLTISAVLYLLLEQNHD